MANEVYPPIIEQVRNGLDLLSKYVSQINGKPPDPSVMDLISHLRIFVDELAVAEDELLATRQEVDLERQRYLDLFSFAPNGYLVTNAKGMILEANRQAAAILNTRRSFLLNMPLSVYILRQDWRKFLELLTLCRNVSNENQEVEPSKICFEDEELRLKPLRSAPLIALVSAAVAYEKDECVLRWSIRDITNERKAQEALRASEMKFRNLAETTAGAILIVQEDQIVYANQSVCKMLGFSLMDLLNYPFVSILHPKDRPLFEHWTAGRISASQARQPWSEVKPFRGEVRFLTARGQECWVNLTAGKLQFNGKLAWVITAFDINARVRSERERTELIRRLVNAQEEERRRIARELHDQAGQMIGAINLGLKSLNGSEPGETQEKLANLYGLVNELSLGIQRLALDLRPLALDDLGLPIALADYLDDWSQRSRIPIDFQCNIPKDFPLSAEVKIAVYRIVQEALNNIQKHAGASGISLILDQRAQQLILVVEDDGHGFDLEEFQNSPQAKKHLGLIGMRERAELIGGRLDIESMPGKGVSIILRVPIAKKGEREESHAADPDSAGG